MTRQATVRPGGASLAPPPGLDRMRPREVRPSADGRALIILSMVLIVGGVAGGIALHLKAVREVDARQDFQARARDTTGVVTRKWRTQGEGRPRWVAYRFTVDGRAFAGETRPSRAVWERLEIGSAVPVRFEPGRPERHFTWGRLPRALPLVVAYLVGLGGILGGALLTLPFLYYRRLLAEGRAALATVTDRVKGQHGTTLRYRFEVLSGGTATGQTTAMRKSPEVGGTLWIVYSSENPRHNRPYPIPLVRLVHETPLTPSRQIVERAQMAPHQGNP